MRDTFTITQELTKTSEASYIVKMTIGSSDDVEVIEFNYNDSRNSIFPLYSSLISTIRGIEDAHIELTTCNQAFAEEINGSPNRNSTMLRILNETKEIQGVTIDAITK